MTTTQPSKPTDAKPISTISLAFLECNQFLKKFLSRFLNKEQDIEDVVQEVFLKAFSTEKDRTIDHPKAFLFSIAKNLALNELNRKSRQMTQYIEECQAEPALESTSTAENENEAQQAIGIYCEAVAALPESCRRVYLLRKVHGLPHKEIAERLNLSLSSVEKHLHNGLIRCRSYIEAHNCDAQTDDNKRQLSAPKRSSQRKGKQS